MTLRLALLVVTAGFVSACKDYSTSDLLSLKFPTGGTRGLRISSPSPVTVGQPFTITVTATNTVRPDGIQQEYQNPVNLTLQVGGGTLASVTGGGWYLGTQNFTVVYANPSLSLNASEVILLRVTDSTDSSFTTVSNNITATSQVVFNQFKVVAPGVVFKEQPFNLTVTATNSDNTTNTAYNGTVNLSTYLVAGTINPTSVTGFVNGVATVSVTLSQSYSNLQLKAVDSVTSSLTGISNSFQVYFDTVSFVAFPQGSNIRSQWRYPTGTTQALIYRDSGSGFQLLQTVFSPTNFYTDLNPGAGPFTYRVVVQDVAATTQYTAQMAASPGGCGTTIPFASTIGSGGGPGTGGATWSTSGSPYCISGTNTVSGSLTINAGVVILAASGSNTGITVGSGATLITQGSSTAPVTFTSANVSPTAGDWRGITFASGSVASGIASDNFTGSGSVLQYTTIEYAGPGLSTVVSLYLDNLTIQNNRNTTSHGGGIFANLPAGQQLVIKNGAITNNFLSGTAVYGGGIYSTQRLALYSSIVANNQITGTGSSSGAGLYLTGDSHLINSTQVVANSFTAASGNSGGGVTILGNNNTIVGSSFRSNIVGPSGAAVGGGIYLGGAGSTVTNNLISNNMTQGGGGAQGGGLYVAGTTHTITKNTLTGNSTPNASAGGGVYFLVMTGNVLTKNLITLNFSSWGPGATLAPAGAGVGLFSGAGVLSAQQNNIYDNTPAPGNVWNQGGSTHDFSNSYWGGPTSGAQAMGIRDSTNLTHPGSGVITTTGALSAALPLCSVEPSDPDCVGANF